MTIVRLWHNPMVMEQRKSTHYHLLGLKPNVSAAEIKRAYRKLVKDYHPDLEHHRADHEEKTAANERMLRLNEAYETLMDHSKRRAYDAKLGISRVLGRTPELNYFSEDEARERYLRTIYNPARRAMSKVLNAYTTKLRALSLDIYDDQLLSEFEIYVDEVESALRRASEAFTYNQCPRSLDAAVHMMRYSIAQGADGLEEVRRFLQNFDYDHLAMAANLFKIAQDLSRESGRLSRA
jgi:molecular chaperone DnaJ